MITNQSTVYQVTLENTGTTTWTSAGNYALAVITDTCGLHPSNRIALDISDSIATGQQESFSFILNAPAAPTSCTLELRMVQEFVEFFGQTFSETIDILAPPNDARDWLLYE